MTEMEALERTLAASVERKGEVPLTNAHLLNIIRMARRAKAAHDQRVDDICNEALAEDAMWGKS